MYFVGLDLAWNDRRPSGLAVLDDAGRLVLVSAATSDAAIAAELGRYVESACLVAIGAPLVASAGRPAEAALNSDFARFDAGVHALSPSRSEPSEQPRVARIAGLLGLDLDPRSEHPRRAIEVHPPAATVSLFRLGRTLKYRSRSGRPLDQLRDELLALVDLLESYDLDPPLLIDSGSWQTLRHDVEEALRKSELTAMGDRVEAVVCAYVALLAARRPDRVTTYGDAQTGRIVTPSLPPDLTPSRRRRATPRLPDLRAVIREYAARQPELSRVTDQFVELVTAVLDEAGINYLTVSGRAKSVDSFAAKAARTVEGHRVFADPLREISDQIGVRVITYVPRDVQAVVDLLSDQVVVHDDRDMGRETAEEGRFGYASRHLLISADPDTTPLGRDLPAGHQAQVQIRTVLQHAWAEFEHDIRYKGTIPPEHVNEFDRRFTLAAGLLELADQQFSAIRDRLRADIAGVHGEPADDQTISPRELAAFLTGQYAEAGWSRTEHYTWMCGLVLELGVTSLEDLSEVLRPVDEEALTRRMGYRHPTGAVRRLDDALLWALGETYIDLPGNLHRTTALRSRLAKMREAA